MKKLIPLCLLTIVSVLTMSAQRRFQTRKNVPTDSIRLSDPAVLADKQSGLYYMTGTGGMMWRSADLQLWEGPFRVTEFEADSWMGPRPMIWAAELHQTGDGWYYYFATFTNQAVKIDTVRGNVIERRASQVLRADNPMGPYRAFGDATYLPADRPTLDGTYWKDRDGKPYLVFCGEWLQNWNGTIEKIELKPDLSGTVGEPKVLFRASDSPWSREKDEQGNVTWNKVTDGPWLFRTGTGRLGMLWTSWVFNVYTQGVAYSASGTLDGPWIQEPDPITPPGYGHSMLFQRFDGQWMMSVHHHSKDARGRTVRIPHFFEVDLSGDKLVVKPTLKEKDMGAYLFTYFSDPTHSLFMAISYDGYTFTPVNNGKPIISGDSIAEQHGIRDPHIYRAPNGKFYIAMTDLHVFGKQKGIRTTQWERPDEFGWGNNRGLVLMASDDLIHWTHHVARIDRLFPEHFGEIGCAWAPQTIWDPKVNKPMVYFTIRQHAGDRTKLYYSYADEDFTTLETEPQLLFEYPDTTIQVLDADICPMPDGRYFMTYVSQENPGGIKYMISDRINHFDDYHAEQIDGERSGCEAPNVWKRIGEDKWVVMYDIYSVRPNNFGFVETSDFKTFTPLGRFNEGVMKMNNFVSPKHGSVIHITKAEAQRLERYWNEQQQKPRTIRSGELWRDDGGRHINAHGGGILKHGDTYYWFGEHKSERTSNALVGVMCYASKDLVNWRNCGVALSVKDERGHDIERGCILERPKVIYNKVTGKFCMWFHLELKGQGYNAARYGVAVADRPEGPYKFLYSQRANAGIWPMEFGEQQLAVIDTLHNDNYKESWTPAWRKAVGQGLIVKRDFDTGQMARDMTLFVDDDGKAYHIFSSEENLTLHIAELTDDYLHHTGRYTRVAPAGHNEAPAIFKHEGTYWMITSGCTGWEPNEARMFSAPSIWGPWTQHPNPCRGPKAEKTFNGQSTFVLTLDDNDLTKLKSPASELKSRFIFMADIWRPRHPIDARYIWLPIEFENGKPVIRWQDEWSLSVPALDPNHLLLDGSLSDDEAAAQPFVYNDFRKAVTHFADTTTLYIRPGVYWVDDPDEPEVVRGENGREPFGCVIRGKVLSFVGLDSDARNIVLASARGQTQGAVGNFTMFDIWCDSLQVENMTLGNFCNVDLDYPLNPALSRKKRSDVITQAHVGYVHGRSMRARNVRFISRLNLNPLNGAKNSYYEDCHFECTDDALNGTAVYRHCDFDFYGQKPFWSTFGSGAMFVDCDFYVKGVSREMYFCKQGGPVTVIDCRYHAPTDSLYIGWTAYPQRWLRCYQKNFTLNGKPYVIGNRQQENTIVMDSTDMRKDRPPYLRISQHEAELQVDGEPLTLTVDGKGRDIVWRTGPLLYLNQMTGDSVTVRLACDQIEEPISVPVTAYAVGDDLAVAVCMVTIKPPLLPPPAFIEEPTIRIENGVAYLDYQLDLKGRRDHSFIAWSRLDDDDCHKEAILAWSNDGPQRQYKMRPGDIGRRLIVTIRPAHDRSPKGNMTEVVSKQIEETDIKEGNHLVTDFSDIRCRWSHGLLPDTWCADGYKPLDTSEYDWQFDSKKPMWEYGEGFNGAVGKGLLQAQRGARLMYTPSARTYNNMSLTLQVDPTKTAGQGFGSATGQYMDVCLKFDTQTLTGYGLRIIRTVKHAKAVDFLLVEYKNGQVTPLTDPVSATCYRTHCTIALSYADCLLSAHVKTTTPKPADSTLPHSVSLSAPVKPNPFGGIHIQHTGSCGESTTILHRLDVSWGETR